MLRIQLEKWLASKNLTHIIIVIVVFAAFGCLNIKNGVWYRMAYPLGDDEAFLLIIHSELLLFWYSSNP